MSITDNPPQGNLPTPSQKWGRWVVAMILGMRKEINALKNSSLNTNKSQRGTNIVSNQTVSQLGQTVQTLTDTVSRVDSTVNVLSAAAQVGYQEWNTNNGVTPGAAGWVGTTYASARVRSATGRLEVQFGGSLNSGNGIFVYSVTRASGGTVVARTDVYANYAQRVAVTGGASFIGSNHNTVVLSGIPTNEDVIVRLEMYSADAFVTFFGGSILARSSL